MINRHLAAAAIGALTLTLPEVSARAGELKVLSAIGMRQVMLDLGPKFERATGKSVIVLTGNPGQIADSPGEAVAKGKAEIALHQLQELMAVPGIEIVGPFPGELRGSFVFSAALGTTVREVEGGAALIAFLRTPAAKGVIKAKGMEPVSP